MQDLFDRITEEGDAAILQMCEEKRQESLTLEFKLKAQPDTIGLTKPDKKNLGAALSGFSNSAGGLLIWGVDARPNDEGIDCAQNHSPIASIGRFASDVSGLVTDYLMPRNEGIEVRGIPSNQMEGGGYLMVLVGPSELRPHMSMAPDDHKFYRRSGDRFFQMEHYEIQDMFNRIAPVQLDVFHQSGQIMSHKKMATIKIGLRNNTRLTGKFPYVHLRRIEGASLESGVGSIYLGLPSVRVREGHLFAGGVAHALHPGQELEVFGVEVPLQTNEDRRLYLDHGSLQNLVLELQTGCENSQMREVTINLSPEELSDLIDPKIAALPA